MKKIILTLPLLLGATLSAEQTNVTWGLQAGISAPVGDFSDKTSASTGEYLGANNGIGIQVGGNLNLEFDRHNQIRFHLTSIGFSSDTQDLYDYNQGYYYNVQNTFNILQFGADYIYNFDRPTRGGYILGGLSLNRVKESVDYSDIPSYDITQSGKVGLRVGGGYHFNRMFSLEGSFNNVSVDKNGSNGFGMDSLSWVSVDAVFRFPTR